MKFNLKKPLPTRKGTCIYIDFMTSPRIISFRIFGYGFVITW